MKKLFGFTLIELLVCLAIVAAFSFFVFGSSYAQTGDPLPRYSYGILTTGTTPQGGTTEVQKIDIANLSPGTLLIRYQGLAGSGAFTGTETASQAQGIVSSALVAMPNIGTNAVVVTTGTAGTYTNTVTFGGYLVHQALPKFFVKWTESGTATNTVVTSTISTQGVTADGLNSPHGTLLIDQGDAKLYQNSGVVFSPTWAKVSSQ